MKKDKKINWLLLPEDKDYDAALSYLTLHFGKNSTKIVRKLRNAKVMEFKAKDLFRTSELSLLGVSNSHVKKDQKKIERDKGLSPLLIVRFKNKPIIADGYHRMCAIYSFDEDALIKCKFVDV